MRLKHQPLWLLHALSNGADATSTVGFGQRRRVRMESLERSIRQIRSPTPVGSSTRSRNSALRWKDRESNPAPAVANTPYRQRACAAPLFTTTNFHFVNGHLTDPYLAVRLRAPVPSLTLGSCLVPASTSLSSAFFSLRQGVISSALGMNALQSLSTSGVHARRCSSVPCAKQGAGEAVADLLLRRWPLVLLAPLALSCCTPRAGGDNAESAAAAPPAASPGPAPLVKRAPTDAIPLANVPSPVIHRGSAAAPLKPNRNQNFRTKGEKWLSARFGTQTCAG